MVLPVPISSVGLARLLLPVVVQLVGGCLALALVVAGTLASRPTGHWSVPLWLTFGLLCLGQWYVLQGELYLAPSTSRGRALITGLEVLAVLVATTAALLAGLFRLLAPLSQAGLRGSAFNLLGPMTLLLPTAVLFAANLRLFLRRDAVAE